MCNIALSSVSPTLPVSSGPTRALRAFIEGSATHIWDASGYRLRKPNGQPTSVAGRLRHGTYEDRQAVVFRRLGTLFRLHEAIPPAGHILDERGIDVARRHLSSSTLWIEQRARRSQKRMELLLCNSGTRCVPGPRWIQRSPGGARGTTQARGAGR